MATVVTKTIGAGGDYATLALWEAATDIDIVSANEQHDGQLLGLSDLGSVDVNILGATTDATRFRRLTFATGKRYDPLTDTGAGITSSNSIRTLRWGESYFEAVGILSRNTGTGRCMNSTPAGDNFTLDSVYMDKTGASGYGMHTNHGSSASVVKNCIAVSPRNTEVGFNSMNQPLTIYNCVAHGFADGFAIDDDLLSDIQNCAGIHISGGEVFDTGSATYSNSECSNNLSTDGTAPGTSSHTSETAANVFRDTASRDYRLVSAHNNAVAGGVDLSSSFTTDIKGTTRSVWDIGAYFYKQVALPLPYPFSATGGRRPLSRILRM